MDKILISFSGAETSFANTGGTISDRTNMLKLSNMKTNIKINSICGSLLFEYDCNTILECLLKAIDEKINLSYADLSYANFSYANLSYANLSHADLSYADFSYANLSYADFSSAHLHSAHLSSANFRSADLSSANFRSADLSSANLSSANLYSANFSYANLRSANLHSAHLHSANLSYADLSYADLSSADLSSADLSSANLSCLKSDKRYISISGIGSEKRLTIYCYEDDKIWCGCFTGTLKQFEEKVKKAHANNAQYLKEYLVFIKYVKDIK